MNNLKEKMTGAEKFSGELNGGGTMKANKSGKTKISNKQVTVFFSVVCVAVILLMPISLILSGTAFAQSEKQKSKGAKSSLSDSDTVAATDGSEILRTVKPTKEWIAELKAKEARLKEREGELEKRRLELETLREDVKKEIAELNKVRKQLDLDREKADKDRKKKIGQLVLVLNSKKMQAPKAAEILAQLEISLAAEILVKLQTDKAGQIVNELEAALMASIIREMDRIRKPVGIK